MIMETILDNAHAATGLVLIFVILRALHNGICVKRMTERRLYFLAFFLIGFRLCQIFLPPTYQEGAAVLFDTYLIGAAWMVTRPKKQEKNSTNNKNIIL